MGYMVYGLDNFLSTECGTRNTIHGAPHTMRYYAVLRVVTREGSNVIYSTSGGQRAGIQAGMPGSSAVGPRLLEIESEAGRRSRQGAVLYTSHAPELEEDETWLTRGDRSVRGGYEEGMPAGDVKALVKGRRFRWWKQVSAMQFRKSKVARFDLSFDLNVGLAACTSKTWIQ
jgi:hypothetical protein